MERRGVGRDGEASDVDHPVVRVGQTTGLVQETAVLQFLTQTLQGTQWLVHADGHGDLGQVLAWKERGVVMLWVGVVREWRG